MATSGAGNATMRNVAPSWIVDEIVARGGEVFFDTYMELALYHPRHGYYSSSKPRYGREGDFLTAPSASRWYGTVLTRLLRRFASDTGPGRLIDVASGDGMLVSRVLETLGTGAHDIVEEVFSVERSPSMRGRQLDRLPTTSVSVQVVGAMTDVAPSSAPTVIHASEFYDALPVARAIGGATGLGELTVAISSGELEWGRRRPREEVEQYFARHGVSLEDGQIAEANLAAESVHRDLLKAVGDDGLCLVLDYGYEAGRLYDPRGRSGGSLSTFHRHELGRDPLKMPGEIDLTAHVNWGDLRSVAADDGWQEIGLWPLAEFLVRAGIAEELEERGLGMEAELDAAAVTARQEVKRLLDPEGMGSDLKMLVQAKGGMVDVAGKALSLD
jgi:SAM-dependent MidA family methyltransferase